MSAGWRCNVLSLRRRLSSRSRWWRFCCFFWARFTFGRRSFHVVADPTQGGLVTSVPDRYIRHRIYAALCLFTLAGLAGHRSWGMGLCGGRVLAAGLAGIFGEEALVAGRYPEYGQYAGRTWRM